MSTDLVISRRRILTLLGAGAAGALAVGHWPATRRAAAQPAVDGHFVGALAGSDIFAGVAAIDREIVVYVCDGSEHGVGLGVWLRGPVLDGRVELASASSGLAVELSFTGPTPEGIIKTADGTAREFGPELAGERAGLFRAEVMQPDGNSFVAGWVVLNSGELRGSILAKKPDDSTTLTPAPPLDLGTLTADIANFGQVQAARVGIMADPMWRWLFR
jgi:hypothetical protein